MFEWTGDNNQEILRKIREHKEKVRRIIEPVFRDDLDEKKLVELANAGKFLLSLDESARIIQLREAPDFIIDIGGKRIGLENRVVRNAQQQQLVGSLANLVAAASKEFSQLYPDLKIQVEIYVKPIWIPKVRWKECIDRILDYVLAVYAGRTAVVPDFLNTILILSDSQGPVLRYNPDAYAQAELTEAALLEAIEDKNRFCKSYRENTGLGDLWLLLVIGETGPASNEIGNLEIKFKIETEFDRIYIFEDFNNSIPIRIA